jgi:predicted metal-dependent phosphoesterase TrpH
MARRIDMHIHTRGSDGVSSAEAIVAAAKRAGLDGIAITDHHRTYTAEGELVARLAQQAGLIVVRGVEYSTAWGHCLAYGVDAAEWAMANPGYYPDMRRFAAWARSRGGVVVPSHPYAGYQRILGDHMADVANVVDGVEVYNGQQQRRDPAVNTRAQLEAGRLGIQGLGGSDAHSARAIGACYTVFDDAVQTQADVLAAIKSGEIVAAEAAPMRRYYMPPRFYQRCLDLV